MTSRRARTLAAVGALTTAFGTVGAVATTATPAGAATQGSWSCNTDHCYGVCTFSVSNNVHVKTDAQGVTKVWGENFGDCSGNLSADGSFRIRVRKVKADGSVGTWNPLTSPQGSADSYEYAAHKCLDGKNQYQVVQGPVTINWSWYEFIGYGYGHHDMFTSAPLQSNIATFTGVNCSAK